MKKQIAIIAKKYHLEMMILFGSVATGRARVDSDVDIAITTKKELEYEKEMQLIADLMRLFKKNVDIVDIRKAGVLLLGEIAQNGKLLYGDKDMYTNTRIKAMFQYFDFAPYFELQEERITKKIRQLTSNAK